MAAKTVDEYINHTAGPVRETLDAVRQVILDTLPDVEEFMKWGTPTYRLPDTPPICYLYGGADHVNLGFLLGAQLDDPDGLLRGEGQKDSRHVQLTSAASLPRDAIVGFLNRSVELAS